MNWISTKLTELANILELNIRDATNISVITWCMDQNMSTVFISKRVFITLEDNITFEQGNLSSHFDSIDTWAPKINHCSRVLEGQLLGEDNRRYFCSREIRLGQNAVDDPFFGLVAIEACRSDHDSLTSHPINFTLHHYL